MYQKLYIYADPSRKAFSHIGEIEAIDEFPEDGYYGSVWTLQLPDKPLPERFVVVDIPIILQMKRNDEDMVPRIEIFLAPIGDFHLYGKPQLPFSRAA